MATRRTEEILAGLDTGPFDIETRAPGPSGALPLDETMLRERPSGVLFGLSQDAGMGWRPGGAPVMRGAPSSRG
jgi:hypothetical protein